MRGMISHFSGFSVPDLLSAKKFYEQVLGVTVTERPEGLQLFDGETFIYPKPNHTPAAFTVLNFVVENIDEAADELSAKGVVMEQYPEFKTDPKGVCRNDGTQPGPKAIAWFKDSAGNILSLIQEK